MFCLRNKINICDFKPDIAQNLGNLSLTVRYRSSNEPVAFAEVSVYYLTIYGVYGEGGEASMMVRHITDENGRIPVIELPVIDRINQPNNSYFVTVRHFRYYPVNIMNIPIYPDITTEYNVMITPLTEQHPEYEFHISPELIRQRENLQNNYKTLF